MIRFFAPLAIALTLALPAHAGPKFGNPPPSPHMKPKMAKVLGRAQKSINQEISSGVRLTAATSQGDTLVFMMRAESVAAAEIGMIRDPGLTPQQRFVKTFGQKFCRKGSAPRAFVDAGGRISMALRLRGSSKLLMGGTLSSCK